MGSGSLKKKSILGALLLLGACALYSPAHSADDPVPVPPASGDGDRIALNPIGRDTARMNDDQLEFFEALQEKTEAEYQKIYRSLPGVTFSQWKAMSRKALNVFHTMHEYQKAMGVYRASLKRASVVGGIVSYIITPAITFAATGNLYAALGAAAIPWEAPVVVPAWMTMEIAAQRLWLRWQLDWANLGELERLRESILGVDPKNRVFSAIFETVVIKDDNYGFNVVKVLKKDENGHIIVTNSVTVEELEGIVAQAENGERFLYELSSQRGPYREYAAILLRIIDVDDVAREKLKTLLQTRMPSQEYQDFRPQFAALETTRAQLNSVSWEIIERLKTLRGSFPYGAVPKDLRTLIEEETAATQNLFREILKHEYTFLLTIDSGDRPDMDPFLKDLQQMLEFRQKFLKMLALPFRDLEEKKTFVTGIVSWRRDNLLSMKRTCKTLLGPKWQAIIDGYRKTVRESF